MSSLFFGCLLFASIVFVVTGGDVQFQCYTQYCLQDMVNYQCEVIDINSVLQWAIFDETTASIDSQLFSTANAIMVVQDIEQFSTVLVSKSPSLLSNISFTVTSDIDGYTIRCGEFNGDARNCTINIIGIPASPQNLTIHTDTFTSSSVSISWTESSSDCVTGYRYNVSSTATTPIVESTSDPAVTTVTVEGLVPSDDQYCVVVTTIDTANRYSNDSDTVCLYYNAPPQPVINSTSNLTESPNTDDVTVQWIFEYNVSAGVAVPDINFTVSIFNTTDDGDEDVFNSSDPLPLRTRSYTFSGIPKERNYTIELVVTNAIGNNFTTIFFDGSVPTSSSSSTAIPSPSMTITLGSSSIALSSTTTSTASDTPSTTADPVSTGPNIPLIIGAVVGGVVVILIIIIVSIILGFCLCKKKSHSVNLIGSTKGGDKDGPIPLRETKAQPETGQGLYQDPNTIEHHKAPTGDLYAMPEKSNKRRAPPQPEMATYQDPNTIQRQQAHTGDLYALPDKKPVYSQNSEGTYADLDLVTGPRSPSGQPLISPSDRAPHKQVLYSDVQSFKQH